VQRNGYGPDVVSKQLSILRKAGIVINTRIRLFEIVPQYFADKSSSDQRRTFVPFGIATTSSNPASACGGRERTSEHICRRARQTRSTRTNCRATASVAILKGQQAERPP